MPSKGSQYCGTPSGQLATVCAHSPFPQEVSPSSSSVSPSQSSSAPLQASGAGAGPSQRLSPLVQEERPGQAPQPLTTSQSSPSRPSSMSPSQSSSTWLQVSAAGTGAEHAVSPSSVHCRLPLHAPCSFSMAQGVEAPSATKRGAQAHSPLSGSHHESPPPPVSPTWTQ